MWVAGSTAGQGIEGVSTPLPASERPYNNDFETMCHGDAAPFSVHTKDRLVRSARKNAASP
jgi:hypothetical protein